MNKKILGMGNAVLDILAEANEEDLTKNNLKKNSPFEVLSEVRFK